MDMINQHRENINIQSDAPIIIIIICVLVVTYIFSHIM